MFLLENLGFLIDWEKTEQGPNIRISGDYSQYDRDGSVSSKRQNDGHYSGLQILAQAAESIFPSTVSNSRELNSVNISSITSAVG